MRNNNKKKFHFSVIVIFSLSLVLSASASSGTTSEPLKIPRKLGSQELIIDVGSDLPKRFEFYEKIFGEYLNFFKFDETVRLFPKSNSYNGYARLSKSVTTKDGVIFDKIEFLVTNPPYISEVYLHMDLARGSICLSTEDINKYLYLSDKVHLKPGYKYSNLTKTFIKIESVKYGYKRCASSIWFEF